MLNDVARRKIKNEIKKRLKHFKSIIPEAFEGYTADGHAYRFRH